MTSLIHKQFSRSVFKRKNLRIKSASPFNPAVEMDLFWLCLAEKCPRNCCGKNFDNGNVLNIYNIHHDQVPLLLTERNAIIRRKGPHCIKMESDGIYYLDLQRGDACPFLKCGLCDIQDIKPSLCLAYPMIQLDCHVGPIFDHDNCPGFEIGRQQGVRMKKSDYILMLENFIGLQQYRLARIRLELNQMIVDESPTLIRESSNRSICE